MRAIYLISALPAERDAVLQSANNKTIIEADLAPPPPPSTNKRLYIFLMSASPIQFGWMRRARALLYIICARRRHQRRGFYNPPWAGLAPLFYCPQTSQAETLGGDAMHLDLLFIWVCVVLQRPKSGSAAKKLTERAHCAALDLWFYCSAAIVVNV